MSKTEFAAIYERMAPVIARWTKGTEDFTTPIPNLVLFRREAPTQPNLCLVEPSVVVVVQGAKQLLVGDHAHVYNIQRFLIASLDIPASSQVLDASPERPCLGLTLKLDLHTVAELIAQKGLLKPQAQATAGSAALGTVTEQLLEPFARLLGLLDEPSSIPVLSPLIEREIHYRLLMSDQAARVWRIVAAGGQGQRIARAIDWLKRNYSQPLHVEKLAAHVNMSTSSLHHHFRELTAMSPLQFQKWLRLNEARRAMLNDRVDAAGAGFLVGYESPSQFSREYSRLFGVPPKRDIEELRRHAEEEVRA